MRAKAGNFVSYHSVHAQIRPCLIITQIDDHAFRMPQLSILTEMQRPQLWIPIPHMYGVSSIETLGTFLSHDT